MKIELEVLGPPQPKQRARRGRGGRWYTPLRTRQFEGAVARAAALASRPEGWRFDDGDFRVEVTAYMPDRRPRDVDNVAKSVLDGLNRSRRVWVDDRQVRELVSRRALDREAPRTVVAITPFDPTSTTRPVGAPKGPPSMTATTEETKPPKRRPRKTAAKAAAELDTTPTTAPERARHRKPPESIEIALDRLVPFALNPRGRVRKDDPTVLELAESIREWGQLVEMVVRPRGADRWEVLGGERRLVALQVLGATSGRCSVRHDAEDDAKALEIAIHDNAQREAVHPLDEADSIVAMMRTHGLSADACAARLAKSVSHVHGLARLAQLGPEGREAFRGGRLTAKAAAALARVSVEAQKAAIVEAQRYADEQPEGEPIPTARVIRALEQQTRALRDAKFPLDVVPPTSVKATACATCPKRSSAQTALFADVLANDTDRCTDSTCWDRKNAWWFEELAARRKADGAKVAKKLSAKVTHYAGKLWDGERLYAADLVPSDEPATKNGWERVKAKGRELTWAEAHEKAFGAPIAASEITVTVDGDGNPREVVSTAVTKRISQAFEKKSKTTEPSRDEAEKLQREQERKKKAKVKLDRAVMRAAHDSALERAKVLEWPDSEAAQLELLRAFTLLSVDRLIGCGALDELECPPVTAYWDGAEKHRARAEHVSDRTPTELVRLLTTSLLARTIHRDAESDGACRARALKLLGVDVVALRAELAPAKKAKPSKAKPKPSKAKKGAKRA